MSESTKTKPEVAKEDLTVILPGGGEVTVNGVPCIVRRLKTREFLALLRVLTAGLGPALGEISIDFTDKETVGRDLSALMLLAVPNAADEFAEFLMAIVDAKDPAQSRETALYLKDNPELDVLLEVFEKVAEQEKEDLAALGGKTQAMWSRLGNLYRPKTKTD